MNLLLGQHNIIRAAAIEDLSGLGQQSKRSLSSAT